jgi:hypothetical protein
VSPVLLIVGIVAAMGVGVVAGYFLPPHGRRVERDKPLPVHRILLPFAGQDLPRRAFDAAVRLARAEDATLMPALLAEVPLHLPLDAPLPRQAERGMPLLEAIEQAAISQGVRVDGRVSRGRSYRDALRSLLDREQVDRVIVSATDGPHPVPDAEDLDWLIQRVPAEVMILRPAPSDERRISAATVAGHF